MKTKEEIQRPQGRLGVLIPGIGGAVSTTFLAGVESIRRGLSLPIGSLSQMGTVRLGKRFEYRIPLIKDFVPLANLDDLVFGGWDIFPDNGYQAAIQAGVLNRENLDPVQSFLEGVKPWPAVFNQAYVKNLHGPHVKPQTSHLELVEALKSDIDGFKREYGVSRCIMIWCASTEVYLSPSEVHASLDSFERGLEANDPNIPPSMLYAYAALSSGIPYINGAPNLTVDTPAMEALCRDAGINYKWLEELERRVIVLEHDHAALAEGAREELRQLRRHLRAVLDHTEPLHLVSRLAGGVTACGKYLATGLPMRATHDPDVLAAAADACGACKEEAE